MIDIDKLDTSEERILLPDETKYMKFYKLSDGFGYFKKHDAKYDWFTHLFVEFHSSDLNGSNTKWKCLCLVRGFSGLRECRHTYFFDNGYVFYMDSKNMRSMLDFLETKYDMG